MKKTTKKHHYFSFGSIAAGLLVIFALIFAIIFLFKIQPNKKNNQKSNNNQSSSNEFQNIQIMGDYTPKYLDLTKYTNNKGELKNVDTTITKTNNKNYKYANTTNNFQTFFTDKISKNGNDIKIQKEDSSITFQVLTGLIVDDQNQSSSFNFDNSQTITSADDQKNRIKYSSIYKKDNANIDVVYTVQNDKLSEEIILNQYININKISQKLTIKNVIAKMGDNQIDFYNPSTNLRVWFIPEPKMYEQENQKEVSNGLYYDLNCQDSSKEIADCTQLILTKTIDDKGREWLSDPNRQYPIVIDPDFQIDSADTLSNWTSSDTSRFTISQETTIKQEGTGSVKINATGIWNSGSCIYSSVSSGSFPAACGLGAAYCSDSSSCWSTDGGTCSTSCTYSCTYGATYIGCTETPCYYVYNSSCSGTPTHGDYRSAYSNTNCGTSVGYLGNGGCDASESTSDTCGGVSICFNLSGTSGGSYLSYREENPTGSCVNFSGSGYATSIYTLTCQHCTRHAYIVPSYVNRYKCSSGSGYASPTGAVTCWTGGSGCGSANCAGQDTCYSGVTQCSTLNSYYLSDYRTYYSGSGSCGRGGTCYYTDTSVTSKTLSSTCSSSNTCSNSSSYDTNYGSCTWSSSLNDTVTTTKTATDLSTSTSITFWVRSTRTGTFMRFQMGESVSTEQTFPVTITTANTWEKKTWDISGIAAASRNAITKFAFQNTSDSSDFLFYFDDIQAVSGSPNPPLGCVISESPTDSYLTPKWSDNSSDENGFQLEKNTDGAGFTFLINLAAGTIQYQDNSISSNHTYSYRVRSFTNVGSTQYSDYNTCPTLNLDTGNFNFEGVNLEGLELN